MSKIRVLLTFDYEIFFGSNYQPLSEVLFQPTEQLLTAASQNQVKLNFFADIFSAWAAQKQGLHDYANAFIKQMHAAKRRDHDVQMHFHPHWHDAQFNQLQNKWEFSSDNWSYAHLIKNLGLDQANDIFMQTHEFFSEHFGEPLAFRAGGLSIQPHEQELLQQLSRHRYIFDSSVHPGRQYISTAHHYDFLKSPEKNFWALSDKYGFLQDAKTKTGLFELPIFSIPKVLSNSFGALYYRLLSPQKNFQARGKGLAETPTQIQNKSWSFSFDLAHSGNLKYFNYLFDAYVKSHSSEALIYVTLLAHPKRMFEESIDCMMKFVNHTRNQYGSDIEYVTYTDLKQSFV